jgi:glycosyltransferase involved in cell wall biosynthesis
MGTPIFIITRDRLTVLKRCIESYKKLGDVEIILCDNNSTYPPMVEYLKTVDYKIYRNTGQGNNMSDISDHIAACINDWYSKNSSDYYIVTDPDIELESPSPVLLDRYRELLLEFPHYICVGPMLRIDDLPECFHFRDQMIHSHIQQFWGRGRTPFKDTHILHCPIDTTFAMYRRTFTFKRLNMGIRVYEPYMAKHLDWYMNTLNLNEEEQYYKDHASDVSTMSMHIRKGGMG